MMIRVGEKVLDGFGARLTKAELFEDGVDGHGPSEQSLSGSLVEQRLGDVEELLRSEQDVVGLIGLVFEHVGRGGRNKRLNRGGAVDDRVAASASTRNVAPSTWLSRAGTPVVVSKKKASPALETSSVPA